MITKPITFSVKLSQSELVEIKRISKLEGKSPSDFVRDLIKNRVRELLGDHCQYCGKSFFYDDSNFRDGARISTSKRPDFCPHCGMRTKSLEGE